MSATSKTASSLKRSCTLRQFNGSIFSPERANYYRCLQTLLLLAIEDERDPLQYHHAFTRIYGAETLEAAPAAISGEAHFYGLQVYEKLQAAKRRYWKD